LVRKTVGTSSSPVVGVECDVGEDVFHDGRGNLHVVPLEGSDGLSEFDDGVRPEDGGVVLGGAGCLRASELPIC
jgi:hypothetical protein